MRHLHTRLMFPIGIITLMILIFASGVSVVVGQTIPTQEINFVGHVLNGGTDTIYAIDANRGLMTKVHLGSLFNGILATPAWSPVSNQFAYQCEIETQIHICLMDTHGNNRRVLIGNLPSPLLLSGNPVWSPDGTRLTVTHQRDLYLINVQTEETQLIFRGTSNNALRDLINPGVWSSDGQRIAIEVLVNFSADVYVVDLQTGAIANVSNHEADDGFPIWSPDGSRLAYTSFRDSRNGVYITTLQGTTSNLFLRGATEFQWSPDGRYILYKQRNNEGGGFFLTVANTQGETEHQLIFEHEQPRTIQWLSTSTGFVFDLVSDSNSNYATGIYLYDLATNELNQIIEGRIGVVPTISPDNQRIATFTYPANGGYVLTIASNNGRRNRYIDLTSSGIFVDHVTWRPRP